MSNQKSVSSNFSGELDWRTQKKKEKLHCNTKYYKLMLQNPTAKRYNFIKTTEQKTPQAVEKFWSRQNGLKNEQFMQISVHAEMKSSKLRIFQLKTKNKPVVVSVLDSSCKRFCDTAIRKIFNLKPEIQIKKLILRIEAAISVNTMK